MKTWMKRSIATLALCFAMAHLSGCVALMYESNELHVAGNHLKKGKDNFWLRALQGPDELSSCNGDYAVIVPALARVGEAGGNTLCFNLQGFNADGTELDPIAVQSVAAIAERCKDQRMATLVRVLGDSTDPTFRQNAVRCAAKAFKDELRAAYLIDGPDAAELAKVFKKKAKRVVVAAPANGDMKLVCKAPPVPVKEEGKEAAPKPPQALILVKNDIPAKELGEIAYCLTGGDEIYTQLDQALMRPEEKADWTPDNSVLSEAERKEGFIALFDGKTLDGWWVKDDNKNVFHVSEEGYIEWLEHGGGALMTCRRYSDFVLRLDWKILPGGNSGVWLRAPRDSRHSRLGIECQLRGDSGTEEPDKSNTGAVYDVIPPLAMTANKEGEWNTLEITFNGPHYKALINGEVVQDLNFDEDEELKYRLRKGFICITDHGDYVAYRNIRLKEL